MTDDGLGREAQLIEEVLKILPDIGKRVFKGMSSDPIAEGRSLGQMKVLAAVHHYGQLSVKDVAIRLGVTMPTASELIEKLAEDGLVVRETNPADRRQVLIALTPTASEFGNRFQDLRRAQIRRAFDALEPEERPIFVKSLRAWADALKVSPEELMGCSVNATRGARDASEPVRS